jgi:hypothetical protein
MALAADVLPGMIGRLTNAVAGHSQDGKMLSGSGSSFSAADLQVPVCADMTTCEDQQRSALKSVG